MHFINHSNHEVVILKDSYVEVMEEVQESDQDISLTNTSPEPVSQHTLSNCLAQSDLLPNQRQPLYNVLRQNSDTFGSSIADLTSTPLIKHYINTGNAKTIKQSVYHASHHCRRKIQKQAEEMLLNGIIKPSVSLWASLSCSALVDTGSPVILLSEKIQRQLNLPATPLKSHYHLA